MNYKAFFDIYRNCKLNVIKEIICSQIQLNFLTYINIHTYTHTLIMLWYSIHHTYSHFILALRSSYAAVRFFLFTVLFSFTSFFIIMLTIPPKKQR